MYTSRILCIAICFLVFCKVMGSVSVHHPTNSSKQGVLDEIFNLIESVSEGFPSYSFTAILLYLSKNKYCFNQK